MATPILLRPIEHGADIVVHSLGSACTSSFSRIAQRSLALADRNVLRGGGGNPWLGLRGQFEVELADEDFLVCVEFGIAAEDEGAAVGGREVNVEHLDGCELVQHGLRHEAGRQRLELCA